MLVQFLPFSSIARLRVTCKQYYENLQTRICDAFVLRIESFFFSQFKSEAAAGKTMRVQNILAKISKVIFASEINDCCLPDTVAEITFAREFEIDYYVKHRPNPRFPNYFTRGVHNKSWITKLKYVLSIDEKKTPFPDIKSSAWAFVAYVLQYDELICFPMSFYRICFWAVVAYGFTKGFQQLTRVIAFVLSNTKKQICLETYFLADMFATIVYWVLEFSWKKHHGIERHGHALNQFLIECNCQ